jgi:hypothetical protein
VWKEWKRSVDGLGDARGAERIADLVAQSMEVVVR